MMISPMSHVTLTPDLALRTAVRYLTRVIPKGQHEADELLTTIETLKRISSTPVKRS